MISRAMAFESAMSEPTSSPSQRSAHCADVVRRGSTTNRRAPLLHPLEEVVEEDRMRLPGVRAPQEDDVRLLDLPVRRRPAARSEHRRQTDDARRVSGAVTASRCCSCPSPGARTSARGSSSRSSPSSTRRSRTTSTRRPRARARSPAAARVERLVPGRGPELAAVADERRGQATLWDRRTHTASSGRWSQPIYPESGVPTRSSSDDRQGRRHRSPRARPRRSRRGSHCRPPIRAAPRGRRRASGTVRAARPACRNLHEPCARSERVRHDARRAAGASYGSSRRRARLGLAPPPCSASPADSDTLSR